MIGCVADRNECKGVGPDRIEWSQPRLAERFSCEHQHQGQLDIRTGKCGALFRGCAVVSQCTETTCSQLTPCATRGCWFSHPLNHHVGRRGTIFVSAIFCLLSVIGSAFTQTWPQLLICRLLLGIGFGTKASTIPVFAAENSPASIRGSLVMGWQLWVAFGIFLSDYQMYSGNSSC